MNLRDCIFIYGGDHFLSDDITLSDLERDYGADLSDEIYIHVRDRNQLTGPIRNKYRNWAAKSIQSTWRDRITARKIGDESRFKLASEGKMTRKIKEKDWPMTKENIREMLKESDDYNDEKATEILNDFKRDHYDVIDKLPSYYDQYGQVLTAPWKGGKSRQMRSPRRSSRRSPRRPSRRSPRRSSRSSSRRDQPCPNPPRGAPRGGSRGRRTSLRPARSPWRT